VFGTIRATSDDAFRRLLARLIAFYRDQRFNPRWGEQLVFGPGNTVRIAMVFQGLDRASAERVWQPFQEWVTRSPQEFAFEPPPMILDAPARRFWDAEFLRTNVPGLVVADDRPGAPTENVFWAANQGEVGQFLHGYRSAWLPAALLEPNQQPRLTQALFASTRHWGVAWHFNKGLAGAPADAVAAARDTAMNPAVLDAFALAISASAGPPAFPGIPGSEPDLAVARRRSQAVGRAMDELLRYWLITHPVNNFWVKDVAMSAPGSFFFSIFAGRRTGDWTELRNIWELSHAAILGFVTLSLLSIAAATSFIEG
jgi:hypothetical protein